MRDADPLIQMLTARPGASVAIAHEGDVAYSGDGVDILEADILEAIAHFARHRAAHGSVTIAVPHPEAARAVFRAVVAATTPGSALAADFSHLHPDRPTEVAWTDRAGDVTIITDPDRAMPTSAATVIVLDAHALSDGDLRKMSAVVAGAIDPSAIAIGRTPQLTGWDRMVQEATS